MPRRRDSNGDKPSCTCSHAAPRRGGISDHTWGLALPVFVGRQFGDTGIYAEASYEHTFGRNDDEYGLSALVLHEVWDGFEVGAELASKIPGPRSSDYTLATNIGFLWEATDHVEVQALAGRTIRTPDGHAVKTVKVELSFNF